MQKRKIVIFMLAFLSYSAVAKGDIIQGEITDLSSAEFSLKVTTKSEAAGSQAKISLKQILISSETEFEGTNFDDLRPGDEVLVDVLKSEGKVLSARKVTLDKVDIRD
jgi:hypothetical protein